MKGLAAWLVAVVCCGGVAWGYIAAPHSLGRICKESTNIVVMQVERVDRAKNLIIYRKVKDLKGNHPQEQIRHNIGQKGSHEREWQTVMAWAKEGRRAVIFHNGRASVTGIDDYWYQCFAEGQWWAMTHGEPFLLRTYWGSADRLAVAVMDILGGKEVVVPAMADGPVEQFHLRTGKVRRIRASLKLVDYDAKRDFVAMGKGEGTEPDAGAILGATGKEEVGGGARFYRGINLNGAAMEIDGRRWEGLGAKDVVVTGERFEDQKAKLTPGVDAARASMIRSCVYGQGCGVVLGNVPKGRYQVYVYVWEDNQAEVFDLMLNRKVMVKQYNSGAAGQWAKLGPWGVDVSDGKIAVANGSKAAANLSGVEVWRVDEVKAAAPAASGGSGVKGVVSVDRAKRRVVVPCVVAARKLSDLSEMYPIEVIATWASPEGQKAHETVVAFAGGIRPSEVHAALEQLGLKAGKPARGDQSVARGPGVKVLLEITGSDGQAKRIPVEQALVDRKTGKPIGALKWRFTGSAMRRPDPEKDEQAYGADVTGTLIALFPVTDDVVIQSGLTMKDESNMKLETNTGVLPKEGAPVKLIIEAE